MDQYGLNAHSAKPVSNKFESSLQCEHTLIKHTSTTEGWFLFEGIGVNFSRITTFESTKKNAQSHTLTIMAGSFIKKNREELSIHDLSIKFSTNEIVAYDTDYVILGSRR